MTKSPFLGKSFRKIGYPGAILFAGRLAPPPELDSCSALDYGWRRALTTMMMRAGKHVPLHSPNRIRPLALLVLFTSISLALSMAQPRRQMLRVPIRRGATHPRLRILKGLSAKSTSPSAEQEWIPKAAPPLRISSTQTHDS